MRVLRGLGYAVAGIAVLLAGLGFFAYQWVGGVNAPFGEGKLDRDRLSRQIEVAPGFHFGVYAADIPNARVVRFSRGGHLLVANPNLGQVVLLEPDADGDGQADGKRVLIDALQGPNGLDFHDEGDVSFLYIAEGDGVGRARFNHQTGALGRYERIIDGLPAGGNHWKKTLRFGPDGMLYVAVGSSCNVCLETDARRAALLRYRPDGSDETIFARGLRNSAGFDWSPADGQIYATDNGRDMLGDDFPPCELNQVVEGGHYGWPFQNGAGVSDPDFGDNDAGFAKSDISRADLRPMVHGFRAHNAPLGISFLRSTAAPADYHHAAVVALHGSWNRREKDGYKVVSLHFAADGSVEERDFVSGFLVNDEVIGRPAELTEGPDGAVYIADDFVGAIYRVAPGERPVGQAPGVPGDRGEAVVAGQPEAVAFDAQTTLAGLSGPDKNALAEAGEVVFNRFGCAGCHGDSAGLAPLRDVGTRYDLETLAAFMRAPKPPMPVFPLSTKEQRSLAVYLIMNR